MPESESTVKQQTDRARIASQFRSVIGTSFLLVLLLAISAYAGLIKPPLTYFLFSLIFIVDFTLQAYLSWKHKVYWLTKRTVLEGKKARLASIVYTLLAFALVCFCILVFMLPG